MINYSGHFTVRDMGKDIPAMIDIYTQDREGEAKELAFSESPAVITWETASITDVIHKSQARVNLFATEDGMYRDIAYEDNVIYMDILVDKGLGYQPWWSGVYADTTWLEPFSREKNYSLQLTFSDFGYLGRKTYEGIGYFENGAGSILYVLWEIVSMITGTTMQNVRLAIHPMLMSSLLETRYEDLLMTDSIARRGGEDRKWLDILTDILDSANVHIIQYDGNFHLYNPDVFAYEDSSPLVSTSLRALGVDAEYESAERFGRIELSCSLNDTQLYVKEETLDSFTPAGNFLDYSENTDGSEIIGIGSGPGYVMLGKDSGGSVMNLLMAALGSRWFNGRPGLPSTLANMSYTFEPVLLRLPGLYSGDISKYLHRIKLSVEFFLTFARTDEDYGLYRIDIPCSATFTSDSGKVLYLSQNDVIIYSSRYTWIDDQSRVNTPYIYLQTESPDKSRSGKYTIKISIPVPDDPGVVSVQINPLSQIRIIDSNKPFGESGFDTMDTPVNSLGICSIKAIANGTFDEDTVSGLTAIKEDISDRNAETFSKEFAMGTPLIYSPSSLYAFYPKNKEVASEITDLMMYKYADFIRRNNTGDIVPRWYIRGTYAYTHMYGLPVFRPGMTIPFRTVENSGKAMFLKSEEWDMRKGRCQLEVEEASIQEYSDGYVLLSPSSVSIGPEGGNVEISVKSRIDGTWYFIINGQNDVVPRSGSGRGTTVVSVSVPPNETLAAKSYEIDLDNNVPGSGRLLISQLPAEAYLIIDPVFVQLDGMGVSQQVSVKTNIPDLSRLVSDSWIRVNAPAAGKLDIGADIIGGRLQPGRSGYVSLSGAGKSARIDVEQAPLGLYLAAQQDVYEIAAEGGTVLLVYGTNSPVFNIVFLGAAMSAPKTVSYIDTSGRQVELVSTSDATISGITIPDDPGQNDTFAFICAVEVSPNAGNAKNTVVSVTAIDGEDRMQAVCSIQQKGASQITGI